MLRDVWTESPVGTTVLCIILWIVGCWGAVQQWHRRRFTPDDDLEELKDTIPVPNAEGGIPLLGNALAYKSNPPGFLMEQQKLLGPVFRINLAGRRMIVIGSDTSATKQVATMPESVASSREAVAAVGFEYTLGLRNVHVGTDFHKRVIRNVLYGKKQDCFMPGFFASLEKAFDAEIADHPADEDGCFMIEDLFQLVRRFVLRAMVDSLLGTPIMDIGGKAFITRFMAFQDEVEDCTAKAAVVPRFLWPITLGSVASFRKRIQSELAAIIESVWDDCDDDDLGPWLVVLRSESTAPDTAADLVIGLLFAAHKNAAIGGAQAFIHLKTLGTPNLQKKIEEEAQKYTVSARTEARKVMDADLHGSVEHGMLRRCVLETLRMTSHSIGAIRLARKSFVLHSESGHFSIRRGETLALCHISTHMDQAVWGMDAIQYKPDRAEWTLHSSDSLHNVDDYKFRAFSHGVHKCPGERLAISIMQFTLALLLERGTSFVDSTIPNVSFERATLAQRDGPVRIKMPGS